MPTVRLTRHLYAYFPQLEAHAPLTLEAHTVAELVAALERLAPGIAFYLCDERGRLRPHVNVFIGAERVRDRSGLSDPLPPGAEVSVLQALSGG
jgi:sulfur-carrier protein